MKRWGPAKRQAFLAKFLNWEYWPGKAFYYPIAPYIFWLMWRSRHICFCTAANPGIYTGGLGLESKFDTLQKIPLPYRPRSVLISPTAPFAEVEQDIADAGIAYPLIAKPDIGFRGLLVKKINSPAELKGYLSRFPFAFVLQEYLDLPEEVGVLYYRLPGDARGQITSITTKEFLAVWGDGQSTVAELMIKDTRALLQLERIRAEQPGLLGQIPSAGEKVALGIVGNHAKGTRFINSSAQIDEAITSTIDSLAQQIEGFYYGRFDLKCASFESLRSGQGIMVIEINGVCSEPTHIYDAQHGSYCFALKEITRHWAIIRRIAAANHLRGVPYMKTVDLGRAFLRLFAYQRKIQEIEQAFRDAVLQVAP
jgi:hypothetical protein